MKLVGLTGGIGSGKTTVARVFTTLGVPVFQADEATREAIKEPAIRKEIIDLLGKDILKENGVIDRKKVAAIVFTDKKKLERLNSILHPEARKMFHDWVGKQTGPYVIKEAAILFESGAWKEMDLIITVTASEEVRVARVAKRDNLEVEEIHKRMSNQMKEEERIRRSHFAINNDGALSVIEQVMEVHKKLSDPKFKLT